MTFRFSKILPTRGNRLALEALVELALARVMRATISFARLAKLFGEAQADSPTDIESSQQSMAKEISVAIGRAVRFAPFHCNCLTQALCGLRMLRRRRLPSTLYLGLEREGDSPHDAHAWLRCGNTVITGDFQLEKYRAVFKFART